MSEELKFINHRELRELREEQYKKQGEKCAISGLPYSLKECVFDHKHKLKNDPLGGPEGLGLLRGVISNKINAFEGKIYKAWKRLGLGDDVDLACLLRQIADYIENPPMNGQKIVHPDERPKRKKLSKPDFKRVQKYWFVMNPRRRILPEYPLDGIETPRWKKRIEKANKWREFDSNRKLSDNQKKLIEKAKSLMR